MFVYPFEGNTLLLVKAVILYALPLLGILLILYRVLQDYQLARSANIKLNFSKTLVKGILISIAIGIIASFYWNINCRVEECLLVLSGPVFAIGGSIFSLFATWIASSKSKQI